MNIWQGLSHNQNLDNKKSKTKKTLDTFTKTTLLNQKKPHRVIITLFIIPQQSDFVCYSLLCYSL